MIFHKRSELIGHSAGIYSFAFNGKTLFSASADKYIASWNLEKGIQDNFAIGFDDSVYAISLINNNHFLAAGLSNGNLHIFDLELKKELKFFTQHKKAIFSISSNDFKSQFYTADADGNFSVWNSENLELLIYLPLDCGKIRRIEVAQSGEYIALACQDENIRIFDTVSFNEISTVVAHQGGTTALSFHPKNPNLIISGGKDGLLKCWNWKTNELLKDIPAHNFVVYDIISVNNGEKIVTSSRDKTIKIWSSDNLMFLQRLDNKSGGHKHSVNCLEKISENLFVSGSDDKKIILWEYNP